jgi:hypothetical protein
VRSASSHVQRPSVERARELGRLIGGPPLLELDVETTAPHLQAHLEFQGGRRPLGGAAPTALPHRREGIGPDDGRAILERDRRKARQQRDGDRGCGDDPGERGVEHLLEAGRSGLGKALIQGLWGEGHAHGRRCLRQFLQRGVRLG